MKQMKKIAISLLMVLTLTMSTAETLPTITPSITVEASTKMKLNKTKAFLIKGQTLTLKLSGFKGKVIWSSSKPSIATINSNGKVTARKKVLPLLQLRWVLINIPVKLQCRLRLSIKNL